MPVHLVKRKRGEDVGEGTRERRKGERGEKREEGRERRRWGRLEERRRKTRERVERRIITKRRWVPPLAAALTLQHLLHHAG